MSPLATSQTGFILLGAALLLIGAGGIMVVYSARMRKQAIEQRMGLIEHKAATKAAEPNLEVAIGKAKAAHDLPSGLTEREQHELIRIFTHWRVPEGYAMHAYAVMRGASAILLALLLFLVSSYLPVVGSNSLIHFLLSAVFGVAGWLLPHYVIEKLAAHRAMNAARGLPDALELLVICVEVGLALEDSIKRAAAELQHTNPDLAEELYLTSADLEILPSQDQALANLAARLDVPSVRSVVSTLTQTLRYGTPLVNALRLVASELRNTSLIEMEERANKLPTLMTLPMILFIMPTIFLVVGGPAALRLVDTFFK